MCILQVCTLEQDLLAVNIHKTVLYLYVAETVLCGEYMLLVAGSILLNYLNRVKVGYLGAPQLQACKSLKDYICIL